MGTVLVVTTVVFIIVKVLHHVARRDNWSDPADREHWFMLNQGSGKKAPWIK